MKIIDTYWRQSLIAAMAVLALPLTVLAHGPEACGVPARMHESPPLPPPPGMHRGAPPPGILPPPYLLDLELSEAQQDQIFGLQMAQAPGEQAKIKEVFMTLDELRRLTRSASFDAGKAGALARQHAQALSQLLLMQAELEAKVRALLSAEQRQQMDERQARFEAHRPRAGH